MARGLEMSGKLAQIVMSNKTFPMVSSFFGHNNVRWIVDDEKKRGLAQFLGSGLFFSSFNFLPIISILFFFIYEQVVHYIPLKR